MESVPIELIAPPRDELRPEMLHDESSYFSAHALSQMLQRRYENNPFPEPKILASRGIPTDRISAVSNEGNRGFDLEPRRRVKRKRESEVGTVVDVTKIPGYMGKEDLTKILHHLAEPGDFNEKKSRKKQNRKTKDKSANRDSAVKGTKPTSDESVEAVKNGEVNTLEGVDKQAGVEKEVSAANTLIEDNKERSGNKSTESPYDKTAEAVKESLESAEVLAQQPANSNIDPESENVSNQHKDEAESAPEAKVIWTLSEVEQPVTEHSTRQLQLDREQDSEATQQRDMIMGKLAYLCETKSHKSFKKDIKPASELKMDKDVARSTVMQCLPPGLETQSRHPELSKPVDEILQFSWNLFQNTIQKLGGSKEGQCPVLQYAPLPRPNSEMPYKKASGPSRLQAGNSYQSGGRQSGSKANRGNLQKRKGKR